MRSRTALGALAVSVLLVSCAAVNVKLPLQLRAANGRFSVQVTRQLLSEARNSNVPIASLTGADLARIDSLLPGPPTTVTLTVGNPDQILPVTGTSGFTDPESGAITIGLYSSWSDEPPDVTRWLARTLARQVSHSVRITTGPGFGTTLLDQLVSEGIATAFDQSAFPGPPDPWAGELSSRQECQQWRQLKPLTRRAGLYSQVMTGGAVSRAVFGESTMPLLTGLAVGYHIVADYLAAHRGVTWSELATTPGRTVYAESGYAPCSA